MKRVLIAGLDPLLREMTASFLADLAIEMRCVAAIADAESECRRGDFDLVIILDTAPFFDGSEPIKRLRPNGIQRPKLLVCSWHHSEHIVLSLLECGVNQYITFPINIRRLRRKINEMLNPKTIFV